MYIFTLTNVTSKLGKVYVLCLENSCTSKAMDHSVERQIYTCIYMYMYILYVLTFLTSDLLSNDQTMFVNLTKSACNAGSAYNVTATVSHDLSV